MKAEADERGRDAARQGAERRAREAEGSAEALAAAVVELREALERQRAAAQLREEMLRQVRRRASECASRRLTMLRIHI